MIPHLRPVKEMATLMHSPEISELMHEEAPIDLLIRLDEAGLSRQDVAGLSLSDADEVLRRHQIELSAPDLRELVRFLGLYAKRRAA